MDIIDKNKDRVQVSTRITPALKLAVESRMLGTEFKMQSLLESFLNDYAAGGPSPPPVPPVYDAPPDALEAFAKFFTSEDPDLEAEQEVVCKWLDIDGPKKRMSGGNPMPKEQKEGA